MYIVPVSLFVVHIATIVKFEIFYSSHDPVRLALSLFSVASYHISGINMYLVDQLICGNKVVVVISIK